MAGADGEFLQDPAGVRCFGTDEQLDRLSFAASQARELVRAVLT